MAAVVGRGEKRWTDSSRVCLWQGAGFMALGERPQRPIKDEMYQADKIKAERY